MQAENGETYDGEWKHNLKSGEGEYNWPDGSRYKGSYKRDKRDGYGFMSYPNGESYDGYWIQGKKEGEGTYKTLKQTLSGVWKGGDMIESKS